MGAKDAEARHEEEDEALMPFPYHTPLNPINEALYQDYAKRNGFHPEDPTYDGRGWYMAYMDPKDPNHDLTTTQVNPNDHRVHYSDYWKTPLHPSFSMQSKYWTPEMGYRQWSGSDASMNPLRDLTGNVLYDETKRGGYTGRGVSDLLRLGLELSSKDKKK